MGDGINTNTQQSNNKAGRWQTKQQEGAANIMARRKGWTMQDKQVTEQGTTQDNLAGDDKTRGGSGGHSAWQAGNE
jgi:hypothetical protein